MRLRKGTRGWGRGRRAVTIGLVFGLVGLAAACDGSPTDALSQETEAATTEAESSAILGDITDGLGLTDDQIEAVREVMEKYRGQGERAGALWYAAAELQGILSSEQIEAMAAAHSERLAEARARRGERDRRSGDGAGRGGRRDGSRLDDLDLSEEQIAEIEQIRESFAPQIEEIRDAVRAGDITREEARARMDEIREAMHEALAGVLTEQQLGEIEERRAEGEARREEAREEREERRQEAQEAMVDALGLSADQLAAIESLRDGFRDQGPPSAEEAESRRAEHREALFEILDDDQEEIWTLHGVLSHTVAQHQRTRRRDGFGNPPTGA